MLEPQPGRQLVNAVVIEEGRAPVCHAVGLLGQVFRDAQCGGGGGGRVRLAALKEPNGGVGSWS